MCGLVGAAGRLTSVHETAFKQLLVVDSLRGTHSVGMAAVNPTGNLSLVKRAGYLPHDFLELKRSEDAFRQVNRLLLGHNRFATQGAINNVNAHPFEFSNIVGAHNGSLIKTSLHKLPDHKEFEVDSENIFHAINELGSEATAKILHGAFALTWWHKQNHTLHFMRNNERPLWYAFTHDNEVIFWASELWMLQGVLGRNNIKHKEPQQVQVGEEYIFHIPLMGAAAINHVEVIPRDFFVAPSSNVYQGRWAGSDDERDYGYNAYRGSVRQGGYSGGSVGNMGTGTQTSGVSDVKKLPPPEHQTPGAQALEMAQQLRSKLKTLSDAKRQVLSLTSAASIH